MSPPETLPAVPYGRLDRILHRIAFASLDMQRNLGNLEHRLYGAELSEEAAKRPVFVTSLPRAGTTVMLEILEAVPEFGSATYRHMPFTLAPLLWQRFSRGFERGSGQKAERAHGDGVDVGVDSPEAFEEMLWMAFWPEHYGKTIVPWAADAEAEDFAAFFRRHMSKIVALAGPPARRYLSKNNANIARLGLIERLFPDAAIVIPIREPFAQTASLMRQHHRFEALHATDPFARRYMEGLGHFEFGKALKPIAFGDPDPARADSADFWLGYWCDAYDWVLASAGPRAVFVDFDSLSHAPSDHLPPLADALGIADPAPLLAAAPRFRPPPPADPPAEASPALVDRARALHERLRHRCLTPVPQTAEPSFT